jgi:glutathionyl-hydroquinone reductase
VGRLIDGQWSTEWHTNDEQGRFQREATQFRERIARDGSTPFAPAAGRYHLYVSLACPWAHRTLIVRKLRRLEDAISVSIVDPILGDDGWSFEGGHPDHANGARYLRDVYLLARPRYTGRVSVPVLWDKQTRAIVNNESREIARMLDCELAAFGDPAVCLCRDAERARIDAEITAMYHPVNNGVYRAGFATTQAAYDEAIAELFAALDGYEARLGASRYLLGDHVTEADVFLFTTLVRFDVVYHYHFKCNLRRISDYPNLSGYLRDLYQTPGIRETVSFEHIKQHYYRSHPRLNPSRVVPRGPLVDLDAPHDRARRG